ncbi:2-oxo-4-hydroxy-4-carboxy--5-ureidoimidazoline (OHCU) decarboxylase [Actinokineospora spheciospongiae]|uniref:2-oxo-4-hydroxy-4-carboxy-5-ureidoimidazoline decarboxylase n=1 Tax=Actinokineospora spheciospongiae TaxID=909613 RepID=W7IKR8_9PSEU|nr:2-oxo-4-hydroxy-4-carboxy-5-ureidoimidazoline decarboxylase [Actinokineospora spheciospongiae]EWC60938.1 2-oxo-4-hydroxy-4-carboxy--5-ureidoimidazoline (OHCU) decarboxylase [Actinokineospora spheciospongiae]
MPGDLLTTTDGVDTADLLSCCASRRWAEQVAARGPFADLDDLVAASAEVLAGLDWSDVLEALAAHPRIGDRAGGADRESGWSRQEQSAAATADDRIRADLVEGNRVYEERFGHVFLVCATGLPAEAVLAALRHRLTNDETGERRAVRGELAKIVELRLGKLVGR